MSGVEVEKLREVLAMCNRVTEWDENTPALAAAVDWVQGYAPALLERIAALEGDAGRYRFIADGARDVVFCCSATDFGDGDTTWGPRAEVLDEQFPVAIEGSPKAKLDAAIDAALDAARVGCKHERLQSLDCLPPHVSCMDCGEPVTPKEPA